jgi:hypothetical protein
VNAYTGGTVEDANSAEYTILSNTATVLTLDTTDTPATGAYSIKTSYTTITVDHPDSGPSLSYTARPLHRGRTFYFSVEAVDIWGNRSGFSSMQSISTLSPLFTQVGPPQNLTTDFTGIDCVAVWDPPTEIGPERDYHIEVRTTGGGAIKEEYWQAGTTFTITFDENARIHAGTASPTLHFSVYTRDIIGNESAAATDTATNAAPSTPSNLDVVPRFGGAQIIWDLITEVDVDEVLVYRHTTDDSGSATLIAVLPARLTEFTDPNATLSTYYYWLKARDVFEQTSGFTSSVTAINIVGLTGWSHSITFAPDGTNPHNTLDWGAGTIYLPGGGYSWGNSFSIVAGTTGAVSAVTYIYFDIGQSTTVLQTTTNVHESVGGGKILICVAEDVASGRNIRFQVFGGDNQGTPLIVAENIAADAITGNEITGNTLSAIFADLGTITAGSITGVTAKFGTPSSEEVELDSDGITITPTNSYTEPAAIKFDLSGTVVGAIYGLADGISSRIQIEIPATGSRDGEIYLVAKSPAGQYSTVVIQADTGDAASSTIQLYSENGGTGVVISISSEDILLSSGGVKIGTTASGLGAGTLSVDDYILATGGVNVGGSTDPADGLTVADKVTIGADQAASPNIFLYILDQAMTTTTDMYGILVQIEKDAGASDHDDYMVGIRADVDLNQSAGEIGWWFNLWADARITDGNVGDVSNARGIQGLRDVVDLDGGKVWGAVRGANIVVDTEAGSEVTGNIYGAEIVVDVDGTHGGTGILLVLTEGTGLDWAIYHVGGTAPSLLSGDLRVVQGLYVGSNTDPDDNDIHFDGNLKSVKSATTYDVYAFYPLTTPLTNTSFDGDSFSDTAATIIQNTSWSSTIPSDAVALLIEVVCRDSATWGTAGLSFSVGPTATYYYAVQAVPAGGDVWNANTGPCPCVNGDIYYYVEASGASTLDAYLRCWGYWI